MKISVSFLVLIVSAVLLAQCATAYQATYVRKVQVRNDNRADFSLSTFNGNIKWAHVSNKLAARQSLSEITIEETITAPTEAELNDVETGFTGTNTDGNGNINVQATYGGSASSASFATRLSSALFLGCTALLVLLFPSLSFVRTRQALLFAVLVVALASAYHPHRTLVFAQSGDYRVDYVVYAPSIEFDSVSLHTDRGTLTVDRLHANQITLSVDVGSIAGTQLALSQRSNSRLSARIADSGDITLDRVSMDQPNQSGEIDLETDGGDIYLHLSDGGFSGSYDVQVTGTGSAQVNGMLVDDAEANGRLTGFLNSASGEHSLQVNVNNGVADVLQAASPTHPASVPSPGTAPPATPPPSPPPSPSPSPSPSPPDTTPIGDNTYSESDFHYRLTQSTGSRTLWTRPPTHRVLRSDRAPENTRSGLHLSAAKNEFEAVQLLIGPNNGNTITVTVTPFSNLGTGATVEMSQLSYTSNIAERRTILQNSASVQLSSNEPTPIWITFYVPANAPSGMHSTTVTVDGISIPIQLEVFDFALSAEIHFHTQLNMGGQGRNADAKQMLYNHRMTPKAPFAPTGFNPEMTWFPSSCTEFDDQPDRSQEESIQKSSRRYLLGEGWNGAGFPTAMLLQFPDNSHPRPSTFCDQSLGSDPRGTTAYNNAYIEYLTALRDYLDENGMLEQTYYYVMNEPQNDEDETLAAYFCQLYKDRVPGLRLAVSEEPKPNIYNNPTYGPCGYDIWIAHIRQWDIDYSNARIQAGEEVWWYSLPQDIDPYPNPTVVTNQGMHARIWGWISWTQRITGYAYYDWGVLFHDNIPDARAELFREGMEDYEYLYIANGNRYPEVGVSRPVDATAFSVGQSLTSWTQNAEALMVARHELGRYIEGSRSTAPVMEASCSGRARGDYFVNFQDPSGQPSGTVTVDGKTYMKIGWAAFNEDNGYGWSGYAVNNPAQARYGYDDTNGYSETEKSYLYDDYGKTNSFEFCLDNGQYRVTASVGRPSRGYSDLSFLSVEGTVMVNNEPTTNSDPLIKRTVTVQLNDCCLTFVMGPAEGGPDAYTFMEYLDIEAI